MRGYHDRNCERILKIRVYGLMLLALIFMNDVIAQTSDYTCGSKISYMPDGNCDVGMSNLYEREGLIVNVHNKDHKSILFQSWDDELELIKSQLIRLPSKHYLKNIVEFGESLLVISCIYDHPEERAVMFAQTLDWKGTLSSPIELVDLFARARKVNWASALKFAVTVSPDESKLLIGNGDHETLNRERIEFAVFDRSLKLIGEKQTFSIDREGETHRLSRPTGWTVSNSGDAAFVVTHDMNMVYEDYPEDQTILARSKPRSLVHYDHQGLLQSRYLSDLYPLGTCRIILNETKPIVTVVGNYTAVEVKEGSGVITQRYNMTEGIALAGRIPTNISDNIVDTVRLGGATPTNSVVDIINVGDDNIFISAMSTSGKSPGSNYASTGHISGSRIFHFFEIAVVRVLEDGSLVLIDKVNRYCRISHTDEINDKGILNVRLGAVGSHYSSNENTLTLVYINDSNHSQDELGICNLMDVERETMNLCLSRYDLSINERHSTEEARLESISKSNLFSPGQSVVTGNDTLRIIGYKKKTLGLCEFKLD